MQHAEPLPIVIVPPSWLFISQCAAQAAPTFHFTVVKFAAYNVKLKLGVELEMKERMLHKRILKNFKKIKGHNKEEIYPDELADPKQALSNI